jgi:hypothetical protein
MGAAGNQPGPNKGEIEWIPIAVFLIISPLVVGLRVWSRLRKGGKLGPDDYVIFGALAASLAVASVMIPCELLDRTPARRDLVLTRA